MNTLNNENIIYVPNTLDGENIISSHLEENALLIDGTNQMLANLNAGNHRLTNVSNAISSTDAVNKSQLDLKADTTYVDTNFLNKVTTTTQNVASKLTFNNTTTDILINPVIKFQNAINTSSNGMVLQFDKNLVNQPNLQIGGLVWLDKAPSNATRRVCEMIVSNDSNSLPLFDIKFSSGVFNPLTISNTQTILRNDDFYIKNKTTLQNVLTYQNATDKFTMSKPLDMNTTNKIINIAEPTNNQDVASKFYVDSHSANNNYLLRNGTLPMTGNLQMGSYKITNLLDPYDLNDGANKYYVDTQSVNTHYLLRNGTLAMTGNLNLATHNLTTTGDINCNDIIADGDINTTADMECADFTSNANQTIGGSSLNVLDVKSSAFFEASVLIETNKHLAFNSGDLSTTNGMLMNYDSGVGYLDVRGTEFRVRTSSTGTPSNIRFKVNDTNTTVINSFFVDGNTTLGNENTDTATLNCKTTLYNTLTFANGSHTDKARIHLIKSDNTSYTMDNDNLENGVLCNNTSTINITMPAKHVDWNNRSYFIKTQTATVNLVQNTGTRIDNDTSTLVMSSDYRGYLLQFDSDYDFNGNIWRLCQI